MSGKIPAEFIDELIARSDIVEIIDSRIPLKKSGHEYKACCPFHGEKTPSFTVSPSKQFYHCFGCGLHGTAISFLMEYDHLTFVDAIEELASRAGIPVPKTQQYTHNANTSTDLYNALTHASEYFRKQLREHAQANLAVDYLKQRGLTGEIAKEFAIGFAAESWDGLLSYLQSKNISPQQIVAAGLAIEKDGGGYYDRFRNRIIFPIKDQRGRVIGFGGRILGDDSPKYLNSPETDVFHKGNELYGLYEAKQKLRKIERILVVEGYMDVVALAQFDVHYAVASLGTATTEEHIKKLMRVCNEIVFCFDADRAGKQAAWKALQTSLPIMKDGLQIRFLFLPDGEDPDTYIRQVGTEVFEQAVQNADPLSDFLYAHLAAQSDMSSVDGRWHFLELAKPLLKNITAPAFYDLLVQMLEQKSGMQKSQLHSFIQPELHNTQGRTSQPSSPHNTNKGPSPVRTAISILLQNPALAQQLQTTEHFAQLKIPGVDVLLELIQYLQQHPNATMAQILENWRESPIGSHLNKLATTNLLVDEGIQAEFLDSIYTLEARFTEQRFEEFREKDKLGIKLTTEEKQEYKNLLHTIHQNKQRQ